LSGNVKLLKRIYDRFNARDMETVLAALHEDVIWADHRKRRSALGHDSETNLITLCRECHQTQHSRRNVVYRHTSNKASARSRGRFFGFSSWLGKVHRKLLCKAIPRGKIKARWDRRRRTGHHSNTRDAHRRTGVSRLNETRSFRSYRGRAQNRHGHRISDGSLDKVNALGSDGGAEQSHDKITRKS
jgi:5-methylcytosine-specific restriction endonuclease McrA